MMVNDCYYIDLEQRLSSFLSHYISDTHQTLPPSAHYNYYDDYDMLYNIAMIHHDISLLFNTYTYTHEREKNKK